MVARIVAAAAAVAQAAGRRSSAAARRVPCFARWPLRAQHAGRGIGQTGAVAHRTQYQ
jgi:hypothetical protein